MKRLRQIRKSIRETAEGSLLKSIRNARRIHPDLLIGFSIFDCRGVFVTDKIPFLPKGTVIVYYYILLSVEENREAYKAYQFTIPGLGVVQGAIHPLKGRPLGGFINRASNTKMVDPRTGQKMHMKNCDLIHVTNSPKARNVALLRAVTLKDIPSMHELLTAYRCDARYFSSVLPDVDDYFNGEKIPVSDYLVHK
jgi:hypothetical protein